MSSKPNEPDQLDAVFARLAERIAQRSLMLCTLAIASDGALPTDMELSSLTRDTLDKLREVIEAALEAARPSSCRFRRETENDYYKRREALSIALAALSEGSAMTTKPEPTTGHVCNGVYGGERHGTQNACSICGEYRSGRHTEPEPTADEYDAVAAEFLITVNLHKAGDRIINPALLQIAVAARFRTLAAQKRDEGYVAGVKASAGWLR